MATRKVIVLGPGGKLQEIQSGDVASGPFAEVDVVVMSNDNAAALSQGQPVYSSSAGACDLANAGADATAAVIGLVFDATIAIAGSGNVQTNGQLDIADWTTVTGAAALTSGSAYFLDTTAGLLTTTVPSGSPNSVTKVGRALSTTLMQINIDEPIKRG